MIMVVFFNVPILAFSRMSTSLFSGVMSAVGHSYIRDTADFELLRLKVIFRSFGKEAQ